MGNEDENAVLGIACADADWGADVEEGKPIPVPSEEARRVCLPGGPPGPESGNGGAVTGVVGVAGVGVGVDMALVGPTPPP